MKKEREGGAFLWKRERDFRGTSDLDNELSHLDNRITHVQQECRACRKTKEN